MTDEASYFMILGLGLLVGCSISLIFLIVNTWSGAWAGYWLVVIAGGILLYLFGGLLLFGVLMGLVIVATAIEEILE